MASSTLKILLAGASKHIPLPCVKPVPLDFANVPTGSKIEFDLEDNNGHIYGYSELAIPQSAYKSKETQINQQIPFYLNKKEKEFVNATVFLIFLNTDTFTPLPKIRTTPTRPTQLSTPSKTTPRKSNSSSRPQTPSKQIKSASKVYSTPQKKIATPQRVNFKSDEKVIHKHIDNLFDEYSHGFENLVKEHYELQEQADLIMKSQKINTSGLQSHNSLDTLPIGSPIKASAIPQPATFGDAVSGTPIERRQTGQFYQGENEVISMRGVQPADEERYPRAQTMPDEYERTMSYKKEVSKSQSPTKAQTQESPCRARREIVERYRSGASRSPSNEKPRRENPKPAVFINLRSDSFRSDINASQEPPSFGSRLDISQSIQLHDNSFTDPNNVSVMRNTSRNQSPKTFRKKPTETFEESALNTSFGNETEQSPVKGRNSYTNQKSQATSRATSPAKRKTSTPGRVSFAQQQQQQQNAQNQDSGAVLEKNLTSNFAYGDITFYKAQIEELQSKLLIRNTELLNKENLRTENEELKVALRRSEEARRELQQKNTAAVRELNLENHQLQKEVAKHIEEKQSVNTKNASLQNKIKELERELENRSRSLHAAESRNAIFNHEIEELRTIRDQLERTQGMIDEAEHLRLEERDSYKMSLVGAQKDLHETKTIIERLTQEKRQLMQELHMTRGDLEQEKMAVQELKDQLFMTNKEFNNAQNFRLVIDSLEQEKQELTQTVNQIRRDHAELSELFEKARLDFAEKVTRAEENEHNLLNKISKLGEERQLCRETIDHLSVEINQLNLKLSSLSSQSTALEHITAIKEDIESQLEFALQQLDKSNKEKEMLGEQIITLSQEHEAAHKKIFDLEEAAAELRTNLTQKDDHIAELKQLVVETKEAQALYFPERDDNIDYTLARFINSRSEPGRLRAMFVRESKGMYQFGAKKISIKVEGDKILIRVGGGYLSIEEFLDQQYYFQSEKMARNQSPVKAMSKTVTPSKGSANKSVKQSPLNRTLTY